MRAAIVPSANSAWVVRDVKTPEPGLAAPLDHGATSRHAVSVCHCCESNARSSIQST
jgi:hypothetical protein